MTEKNLKASLALLVFFLLDTAKPFAYSLAAEFTFLGIVLISLNFPLRISLILAVIFGYLKDTVCMNNSSFSLIEFSAIVMLIHYGLRNFHRKTVKILLFLGALIVHIAVNSFQVSKTYYSFLILFFIHSTLIFLLINHIFLQWVSNESKNVL